MGLINFDNARTSINFLTDILKYAFLLMTFFKNEATDWCSGFTSDKFEKILGAGHAQQEKYVVLFFELSYYERTLVEKGIGFFLKCI